ncbi:MAG: hypothetical protein R3191_06915 [Anaerolineales bacterium]|nr:hypothetical protein [Anaerolineales bacterium]
MATQWEYGYLKFHTGTDGRKAKLFFAGEEAQHFSGDDADLLKILQDLGRDGWEAFSHTYDFDLEGHEDEQWMSLLLKRPG